MTGNEVGERESALNCGVQCVLFSAAGQGQVRKRVIQKRKEE